VPVFKPSTFGIFLSQMSAPTAKVVGTANFLWSKSDLGAQWSPMNMTALVADFNGDGFADVLLQSTSGSNRIAYGNSAGTLGTSVAPAGNVAGWNSNSYTAVVGRFGNSSTATLYLQAKDGLGNNYYTSNISAGSVSAYASNLTLMANVPTAPPTAIGATPASADVTKNGIASYSIPIKLPRGTAGLTPDLSLTYSSGAGNGLVGVGWDLSGLGMIARCPKTLAQDGIVLGVQLTTSDEYCLNGNRLRRVSGSQGQTNSQYRTELETFALVTVLSHTSSGPTTWQVKTKDGLIYEYGGTADSRIGVPGNTSVIRVWALSKVNDRALTSTTGNYWTVSYINDAAGTGAYRPDYIDYTTSSVASPSAAPYRVKFYYENRNSGENVVSYYMGGLINQTQRLKRVELQSSGGAALIRKYTLEYQVPASTFNVVSRLGSVQECSPTACMAATTFAWSDAQTSQGMQALGTPRPEFGAGGYSYVSEPGVSESVSSYSFDINGDGIIDALQVTQTEYAGPPLIYYVSYELLIGSANGQYGVSMTQAVTPYANGVLGVWDRDDDGKDDFNFIGQWLHQKSDGTYALEAAPTAVAPNEGNNLVDIDGDGFLDSVNVPDNTHLKVRFHKRDGTSGFESTTSNAWTASPSGTTISPKFDYQYGIYLDATFGTSRHISRSDINGDGRQDLMVEVNNGWRALYSNGTGFVTGELIVSSTLGGTSIAYRYAPIPIDLNGDGCTDFAYTKQNYWYLAKSTCGAVGASLLVDVPTGILVTGLAPGYNSVDDPGSVSAADFNGDGNMDLMVGPVALLSNGITLVSYTTMSGYAVGPLQFWSDRNGDGVVDYVYCNQMTRQYSPGLGTRANLLVSATDGFGKNVAYGYAPLTDSSVYTRGNGAVGRTQDTQSSMPVVKSMALSDGVGGTYTQSYEYAGAKRNLSGRGFLGFASREVTDSRTSFVTRETYNNSVASNHAGWELAGNLLAKTVYQYKNGSNYGPKVDELTQDWFSITPSGNSAGKYPFIANSVSKRYELAGTNAPFLTTTTSIAGTNGASGIDGYGTIYDTTTTTVEGISGLSAGAVAVVRSLAPPADIVNDTTNWCIGRPQRLEDIRSHTYDVSDGAQITRVKTQVWNAERCRVTQTTVAPGSNWHLDTLIEYDQFNNVNKSTVTGSGITNPIVAQAYFGGNGHLQRTATNAKGHITTFDWNVNLGFQTTITDPNGQTTTRIPDDFGREKEVIRPDGTRSFKSYFNCTLTNSFCGDGLLRYVVRTEERNSANDPNNLINYSDQFMDVMGRVKYVQSRGFSGQTVVTETLYDNRGNVALKTNPYYAGAGSASGSAMTYDALNRLVRTDRPVSDTDRTVVSEHVVYDGLRTRNFNAYGIEKSKTSNVLGTIARATDEGGKSTSYTYNSFGDLLKATDPANNSTTIQYNVRGFKSSSMDPDMGSLSFTHDALGQMLTQTDAKNQTTAFTYDEFGRPKTRIDHPGGAGNTTTWTWDGPNGVPLQPNLGQLVNVTSPGGYSESFAYDDKARRRQSTIVAASTTFATDFTYDPSIGKLASISYPSSTGTRLTVVYGYQNGFTKEVRDASTGGVIWQANTQDARGHVTQAQYGNGQVTNLGFDLTNGRLYSIQTGANAATQNLTYAWDAVGNLTSRRDNNQGITESFGYDSLYRLTNVQRNGTTTATMSYDAAGIGNITNKSDVGSYDYSTAQPGCSYYAHSQPHAVRRGGANSYCYDENGNMTSKAGTTVSWSSYNYPLTISQPGGNSVSFSYGADRNRYRTVSVDQGVTEDKIEVADGMFEKVVTGSSIQYRHQISADKKVVAILTRNATTSAPTVLVSAKTLYLHDDHLGSLDAITDHTSSIVLRTTFDAWGKRRASNWSGAPSAADNAGIAGTTRRGYTGHQQLDNLNLVHMNGRIYDPIIARFMSADPIVQDPFHSQAFNRYSYVWNNPLNATDPTGNVKCTGSKLEWDACQDSNGKYTAVDVKRLKEKGIEAKPDASSPTGWTFRITGGNNSAQQAAQQQGSSESDNDNSSIFDWWFNWHPFDGLLPTYDSYLSGVNRLHGGPSITDDPVDKIIREREAKMWQTTGFALSDFARDYYPTVLSFAAGDALGEAAAMTFVARASLLARGESVLLREHLQIAVARFDVEGYTARQAASIVDNPNLAAPHRGTQIDTFFKESVSLDSRLNHLEVTPRFKFGPDVFDPASKRWWDVTTPGQWDSHTGKYSLFGDGTPLFTQ
jgi:RHS repeat-associated protein